MSNAPHRDSEMKTMLGIPLTTWAAANGPMVRRDLGLEPMKEAKMDQTTKLPTAEDYELWKEADRRGPVRTQPLTGDQALENERFRQLRSQEHGYARQGASGDGKVRRQDYEDDPNAGGSIGTVIEGKRRPMTEAEERLIAAVLDWRAYESDDLHALGPIARNKLDHVRGLASALALKPMTPEERAVIEAAKAFANWNAVTTFRGIEPLPELQRVIDAVRRLG